MDLEIFFIRIIHIFILGIFLLYVGITKPKKAWPYIALILLGVIAIIVFLSQVGKEKLFWVMWHVLFVGVVLLWIGGMRNNAPDFLYKLLIIIGSAAIGYHLIRLFERGCENE